jgi:hypothetical protein
LLDWRDWPSYLYLTLGLLLFIFVPFQVYRLYQKSQDQAEIIRSISKGDPNIRQILELAASDPLIDWAPEEIEEKLEPAEINLDGVELLSHSRIYDLRAWTPEEESSDRRGNVYVRDRITMQLLDSYQGDGRVTFQFLSKIEDVQFRQPREGLRGTISRVKESVEVQGQQRTLFEFEYDLSQLPVEEPVTIELELIGDFPKTVRAPFTPHGKTDLIAVWLLFPENRPYRTYSLVSYPMDRSEGPKVMNSRYTIDHPYGSLIGWSVVNPDENRIYECRWTFE